MARARELVPRTHGEAIVAPVDAVAHRCSELERDWPRVLDVEIGQAPSRIELKRCGKRGRRTHIEALSARAAALLMRLVDRQLRSRKDRSEEQPRAELAADQHRMLPLPAEPCRFRQWLLH